jgi:hypothetical protein
MGRARRRQRQKAVERLRPLGGASKDVVALTQRFRFPD